MSRQSVLNRVSQRLSQDQQGDRGWFIITRVHVEAYWLKDIADYIFQKYGRSTFSPDAQDYRRLAQITGTGVGNSNPGLQLRRHHLLVMYKPLQLIERINPRSWAGIRLTREGFAVSQNPFFSVVLEKILDKIVFAQPPAIPSDRIQAYAQFNIAAYDATRRILQACDGYINRDEFDYFVSRVRKDSEIPWAIDGIIDYRQTIASLSTAQVSQLKSSLNALVRNNLEPKQYQNWRDIALHTFSLFGVGTSMVRRGTELWLTSSQVGTTQNPNGQANVVAGVEPGQAATQKAAATKIPVKATLKIPNPPEDDGLLAPPVARVANGGAEAENLVAKLLQSDGWRVVFYSNKRGYGFDIWATKDKRAMVIEVKSSLKAMGDVTLTDTEHDAASTYKENYILAIVENAHDENPSVLFISNPMQRIKAVESDVTCHRLRQGDWRPHAAAVIS